MTQETSCGVPPATSNTPDGPDGNWGSDFPDQFDFASSQNFNVSDEFEDSEFVGHYSALASDGFGNEPFDPSINREENHSYATLPEDDPPVATDPVAAPERPASDSAEILQRYQQQAALKSASSKRAESMQAFENNYKKEVAAQSANFRDIVLTPDRVQEIKDIMKNVKISYVPSWARDFDATKSTPGPSVKK
eukprot:TRINITY_DN32103_c0_g1_i1.p1 TRINITY_DN32103_c0_g1~~TRINITY_DN32103_c0_g1_i1.p1  ORF type:complete len:208 (+),score=10.81 TRINITY_DN32103_c0_g1_i1:48-626(+)